MFSSHFRCRSRHVKHPVRTRLDFVGTGAAAGIGITDIAAPEAEGKGVVFDTAGESVWLEAASSFTTVAFDLGPPIPLRP